ncbi:MAG: molybdenum cofactor guanylyltransferase [Novosphingobium sp.]|nr:molybdenum cofactor guanylyltransferase [Novosphingobium sp.]
MILGVVLSGGKSTRFGSDKALAEIGGHSLLTRAVDQLSGWCEQVVIVGREEGPAPCIADWPRPGMGPLAGIAAGLHHARDAGFDAVLSCGVDSWGLPAGLPELLSPAPAFLAEQPVIGLWPASAAQAVEDILTGDGRHSMRAFAERIGARAVQAKAAPANINTPEDLAAVRDKSGLQAPKRP